MKVFFFWRKFLFLGNFANKVRIFKNKFFLVHMSVVPGSLLNSITVSFVVVIFF